MGALGGLIDKEGRIVTDTNILLCFLRCKVNKNKTYIYVCIY